MTNYYGKVKQYYGENEDNYVEPQYISDNLTAICISCGRDTKVLIDKAVDNKNNAFLYIIDKGILCEVCSEF